METPPNITTGSRSCSPNSTGSSPKLENNGDEFHVSDSQDSRGQTRQNHVSSVVLRNVPIVSLYIDGKERLCLAQISNTLLRSYSYNEIHNRRVALGITCIQCTPVQLEILRRAGAMPVSSRRCGMITKREAERLVKSFLEEIYPPKLPDNFAFDVVHTCGWGCRGYFMPSRYNSSRAKCIKCYYCNMFFSPNKFIFHCHRTPTSSYRPPDAANFNSWRRHVILTESSPSDDLVFAWEDVKAMFNGGSRKRVVSSGGEGAIQIMDDEPEDTKRIRVDNGPSFPTRSPYPYPIFPLGNPNYAGFYSNFFQRPAVASHPAFPLLSMERPSMAVQAPYSVPQERCKFNMAEILRSHSTNSPSFSVKWDKNFDSKQTVFPQASVRIDKKETNLPALTTTAWNSQDCSSDLTFETAKKSHSPSHQAPSTSAFRPVSRIGLEKIVTTCCSGDSDSETRPKSVVDDKTDNVKDEGITHPETLEAMSKEVDTDQKIKKDDDFVVKKEITTSVMCVKDDEKYKNESIEFKEEIQRLLKLREKADHDYHMLKDAISNGFTQPEEVKTKLSEAQSALEEFAARIRALKEVQMQ